ncbi:MAG: 2-C-methyl-D-erythritol 4-phosphate cytidylyltransferase [Parachlamydiaceae bacterium]|nr:2-C-methyl-D-erythritol 4-phosphate cytidylyltransferase [Parachlamydiaceae bacterium]
MKPFSVVYLSGGVGTRMRREIPKQYLIIDSKPIALYGFECFLTLPEVEEIVVVCEEKYENFFNSLAQPRSIHLQFARPGDRRQDSVLSGIQKLKNNPLVCIHDSARPFIDKDLVRRVVNAGHEHNAATVGMPVKMTIKKCDALKMVTETPQRDFLWEIQTPQVVRLDLLKEGFEFVKKHQQTVTDDVSLVELIGKPVQLVEGSYFNIKITTPEDLVTAEQFVTMRKSDALL